MGDKEVVGGGTHNQTHNGLTIRLTTGLTIRLTIGLTIGLTIELTIGLTIGLTIILAIGPTIGLTTDSQQTHNGLTMDSQWTHKGLAKDSQRTRKIHTKIIEKALGLLGSPRQVLFLQWFYKVVREKCCFKHWFYKGCPRKTL